MRKPKVRIAWVVEWDAGTRGEWLPLVVCETRRLAFNEVKTRRILGTSAFDYRVRLYRRVEPKRRPK